MIIHLLNAQYQLTERFLTYAKFTTQIYFPLIFNFEGSLVYPFKITYYKTAPT